MNPFKDLLLAKYPLVKAESASDWGGYYIHVPGTFNYTIRMGITENDAWEDAYNYLENNY